MGDPTEAALITAAAKASLSQAALTVGQWGVMNALFETAPLTLSQWLVCLLPMLPMIPMAIFTNWLDRPSV